MMNGWFKKIVLLVSLEACDNVFCALKQLSPLLNLLRPLGVQLEHYKSQKVAMKTYTDHTFSQCSG